MIGGPPPPLSLLTCFQLLFGPSTRPPWRYPWQMQMWGDLSQTQRRLCRSLGLPAPHCGCWQHPCTAHSLCVLFPSQWLQKLGS